MNEHVLVSSQETATFGRRIHSTLSLLSLRCPASQTITLIVVACASPSIRLCPASLASPFSRRRKNYLPVWCVQSRIPPLSLLSFHRAVIKFDATVAWEDEEDERR